MTLRERRKELGLTMQQLADLVGVTVGSVEAWEHGRSCPELKRVPAVADALDLSIHAVVMAFTEKEAPPHG